jgi:hypothetical protein
MLSEEDFIPGVTPSSLREPQRQQLCEINLITPCHNRIHAHARESTHVKTLLFDHSCKSSREKAFLCEPSGFSENILVLRCGPQEQASTEVAANVEDPVDWSVHFQEGHHQAQDRRGPDHLECGVFYTRRA